MSYTGLVDAQSVFQHLDDPAWVIVDCRHSLADFSLGRKMYAEGHIPGAFFADVEHDLAGEKTGSNGRHPLPEPEALANYLRALGVDDDTQIVAYDAGGDMFAARLWFLCKWIGHERVAVLDGGLAAWLSAGYALSAEPSDARSLGSLAVRLDPHLVVDAAFVLANMDRAEVQLVDARGADRFRGENETIDPVAGHIPGAENHPFKANFAEDLRFKSPEELRALFARFIDADHVIHQCGSGVSGAVNMLAMHVAGFPASKLYAGSWSEWIANPDRPVTKDV